MINNILLVALGGVIGSTLRFFISEIYINSCKDIVGYIGKFPISTFTVNIIGSFFAGIVYFFIISTTNDTSSNLKHFVLIGILGSFTTFSSFSLDSFRLLNSNNYTLFFIYIFLSVLFSILFFFAGFNITKAIF